MGIIPSINGKIELVYEGEQEGADQISFLLINEGIKTIFNEFFPIIKKLENQMRLDLAMIFSDGLLIILNFYWG